MYTNYLNYFKMIKNKELHDTLSTMENNGSYNIATIEFLKRSYKNIQYPLLNLINTSMQTGTFPTLLKQ